MPTPTPKQQARVIAAGIDRVLQANKRMALALRQGSGVIGPSDLPMLAEILELNTELLSRVAAIIILDEDSEE